MHKVERDGVGVGAADEFGRAVAAGLRVREVLDLHAVIDIDPESVLNGVRIPVSISN
jgi:hypothetical protein